MAIDPREFGDLKNFEGFDGAQEIDGDFLRRANISWLTRLLLRIALPWGFARLAKELSRPGLAAAKRAHAVFAPAERVDLIPSRADLRGFRLVLDQMLVLYFIQDGDHFIYDGFEFGTMCEEGDVTVFDGKR